MNNGQSKRGLDLRGRSDDGPAEPTIDINTDGGLDGVSLLDDRPVIDGDSGELTMDSTALGDGTIQKATRANAGLMQSSTQFPGSRTQSTPNLPVDPSKISPKLGELLLASGKMNEETVSRVLHRQKKFPNRRFGELAVARRFASQRDVDAALAQQFGYTTATGAEVGLSSEIAVAHAPYGPFSEVLRGLRSQLMLKWFDGSLQQCALAVTSVDPGDGKSFIIANLGVVFSQLGERTLIIDADLRNSTQHKKFGLRNKMGLSGLLSGRAGIEEILAVRGLSNLAVLPAGPLPPNPQELLGREVFGQLINALSNSFDVILIDTPAAQMSTDAQIIAQRARAALIVGRKDKTRSTEIEQLGQVLGGAGIKVLGSVLNDY